MSGVVGITHDYIVRQMKNLAFILLLLSVNSADKNPSQDYSRLDNQATWSCFIWSKKNVTSDLYSIHKICRLQDVQMSKMHNYREARHCPTRNLKTNLTGLQDPDISGSCLTVVRMINFFNQYVDDQWAQKLVLEPRGLFRQRFFWFP